MKNVRWGDSSHRNRISKSSPYKSDNERQIETEDMQEEINNLKSRIDTLEAHLAKLMDYVLSKHLDKEERVEA